MHFNNEKEDMDIDTETFEPYEIDFSNKDWQSELITKMYLFIIKNVYAV